MTRFLTIYIPNLVLTFLLTHFIVDCYEANGLVVNQSCVSVKRKCLEPVNPRKISPLNTGSIYSLIH